MRRHPLAGSLQNAMLQGLTLLSALLVNFFIPFFFGMAAYGTFLKANIPVFLFHKFAEVLGEPLLSQVDDKKLLPVSVLAGLMVLGVFALLHLIWPTGSIALLASMLLSNCLLLTLYGSLLRSWILTYLLAFVALSLSLLFLTHRGYIRLDIESTLLITNVCIAGTWLFALLVLRKIRPARDNALSTGLHLVCTIPRLFSLTLVNNLFTNILPFYLSFVFPPAPLGLFRVEASLVQSATALFPVNTRVLAKTLLQSNGVHADASGLLHISMHYFFLIAWGAALVATLSAPLRLMAPVFVILPLYHVTVIAERYLLASGNAHLLRGINLVTGVVVCGLALCIHSLPGMLFLYAAGLALYVLLMQGMASPFPAASATRMLAFTTPWMVLAAHYALWLECALLTMALIWLLFKAPVRRNTLHLLGH